MEVIRNQENREKIGKQVAKVINEIFNQGTDVSVHWNLQNARTEHTGVYVSAFVQTSSVTREERRALREYGLHLVEQASHITENPYMDDNIQEIPRENLSDAAETDTELVLELDEEFIENNLR